MERGGWSVTGRASLLAVVTAMAVAAVALTAGPPGAAAGAATGPAAPARLHATNGASSVTLTWSQPSTGSRPVSFRVYEGSAVVARNTTTHVTVPNLDFNSTHTYRVTAVDRAGRESAPSEPVTRNVLIGGPFACGITAPSGLAATAVTASAVSLSWSNAIPPYDQPGTLVVLRDGATALTTTLDSARIGGLAPGTAYTFVVARRDCMGNLHPSAEVRVTTAAGPADRPAAPAAPASGARTASSVALSWPAVGGAARYAVYHGATRVATTTATSTVVTGLWRETGYELRVAALNAAGNESVHSAPTTTSTLPCPDSTTVPAVVSPPSGLTATPTASSSVALSWAQVFAATSFTVYRMAGGVAAQPVVTTLGTAAMVTGLPPDTPAEFTVVAHTAACGTSAHSAPVRVRTPVGPAGRPEAPANLRVTASTPNLDFTATMSLAWDPAAGGEPVAGYRLYSSGTLFATSDTPEVTLRLRGGPTHSVTAVAVDAAGNESGQSPPVVFTVPFIPPP